jgi:hypothetical protein
MKEPNMRTRRSVEAILHSEAERLADPPTEPDAPIAGPNSYPDVPDSGFDPEPTTDDDRSARWVQPGADAGANEALRRRIAERAYLRAERRGFAPGRELEDWLAAESDEAAAPESKSDR